MPTVFDVATYFLSQSDPNTPRAITPLKLQKLVYYAQGWSLAILGDTLFEEELMAWRHGPVAPKLYQEYKNYGYLTIPKAEFSSLNDQGEPIFTQHQLTVLNLVWKTYGEYDGKFLEELTHREEPWLHTRQNSIMDTTTIQNYFTQFVGA